MDGKGNFLFWVIFGLIYLPLGHAGKSNIKHYENTPMQYTAIFHGCKNDNFHIFALNIYYWYMRRF